MNNKFANFSDRELMILSYEFNHPDYYELLSTEFIPWNENEQKQNIEFVEDADRLSIELHNEIMNRFHPCIDKKQHNWKSFTCVNCRKTRSELEENLPNEVEVV